MTPLSLHFGHKMAIKLAMKTEKQQKCFLMTIQNNQY